VAPTRPEAYVTVIHYFPVAEMGWYYVPIALLSYPLIGVIIAIGVKQSDVG